MYIWNLLKNYHIELYNFNRIYFHEVMLAIINTTTKSNIDIGNAVWLAENDLFLMPLSGIL